MDCSVISPVTRHLLDRADRAIEESVRLRHLNAEIRHQVQIMRFELERQRARSCAK